MKKVGRRIWTWILSGLTLIVGANGCIRTPFAKVYGPPPRANGQRPSVDGPLEDVYGPPAPEMKTDSTTITEE